MIDTIKYTNAGKEVIRIANEMWERGIHNYTDIEYVYLFHTYIKNGKTIPYYPKFNDVHIRNEYLQYYYYIDPNTLEYLMYVGLVYEDENLLPYFTYKLGDIKRNLKSIKFEFSDILADFIGYRILQPKIEDVEIHGVKIKVNKDLLEETAGEINFILDKIILEKEQRSPETQCKYLFKKYTNLLDNKNIEIKSKKQYPKGKKGKIAEFKELTLYSDGTLFQNSKEIYQFDLDKTPYVLILYIMKNQKSLELIPDFSNFERITDVRQVKNYINRILKKKNCKYEISMKNGSLFFCLQKKTTTISDSSF